MKLDKKTGLRVWSDAYRTNHQMIADEDRNILYSRTKYHETAITTFGVGVTVDGWGSWEKCSSKEQMSKAWFVRELTVEDLILGQFDKE